MPVGAQGSAFKLYSIQEATENVAPAGNWGQMPCFTFGVGADQELSQDEILSANANRDPADPFYGKVTVEGAARVPLDTTHFGRWLRMLLGAPVTSGTTNYTHVWKSGSTALPSQAFEKSFPDIGRVEQYLGCRANTLDVGISDTGGADATVGLLGMQEITAGASGAGTPIVTPFVRFQRPQGLVRLNETTLAAVTGGTIRFSNDMAAVDDTIRADDQVEGVDFGQAKASGDLTLRFLSHAQVDLAIAKTPVAVEYSLTIDANRSLTFLFPRAFLQRRGRAVDGPRGLSMTLPFIASHDPTSAAMMVVTLKNQVAAY
tara:strand:- start:31563 stop:32513 length:951 start_codon:yes stop_codon:yes gene_type:complete